jgi:hypothetical protein
VAATNLSRLWQPLRRAFRAAFAPAVGLLGGLLAGHSARAVDLPEDRAEALVHVYNGGGVTAAGPAFLVRKNIADRVSLTGSYYLDAVSNASIDVVTTASPFRDAMRWAPGWTMPCATR